MDARKKAQREAAGFRFGDAGDFLGLSDAERAVVEIRVSLARRLREMRLEAHLTQAAFAKQLHSSQSRVAKMEAGDPTVTIDLLIQALLAVGADRRDVAKALAGAA
jgi:DNA-binding XRE family transcriptional regulator